MKRLLFLLLTFFFSIALFSQKLTGKIVDFSTNKPIENAHITIKNKVVLSDKNGNFTVNLYQTRSLKITHVKYQNKKIRIRRNQKRILIKLKEKQEKINEVVIKNKRKKIFLNYSKLPNLPEAIYGFASILHNGKIYVFGGDKSRDVDAALKAMSLTDKESIFEILKESRKFYSYFAFNNKLFTYDIKNKTWNTEESKFKKRSHHNAIVHNNKVYLFGGKRLSKRKKKVFLENEIEVFDLASKKITVDKTNPHTAVNAECLLYKDNVLIFGGSIKELSKLKKRYNNDVHSYNLNSGLWFNIGKMPNPKETKAVVIKDKVYLFGGYNNNKLNTITSFNLKNGKWKKEGKLLSKLKNPAIANDHKFVYLFEEKKLITYNLKTKKIKEYKIDLPLFDAKLYTQNNKLYILGGSYERNYETVPTKGLFSVDLKELKTTRYKTI